jgi:hypothetical protein
MVKDLILKFCLIVVFLILVLSKISLTKEKDLNASKCLMIKISNEYKNSVVGIDPIEAKIIKGEWTVPKIGEEIKFIDESIGKWEAAIADEDGWIRHQSLRSGYIYYSIDSEIEQTLLLNGFGYDMVFLNGIPRIGNRYGYKDNWESWEPQFNFSVIPIKLQAGKNEFLFKCMRGRLKANFFSPEKLFLFNSKDITIPDFVVGEEIDMWGSIVVINATNDNPENIFISSKIANYPAQLTPSSLIPMSLRKVGFKLLGKAPVEKGDVEVILTQVHPIINKTQWCLLNLG